MAGTPPPPNSYGGEEKGPRRPRSTGGGGGGGGHHTHQSEGHTSHGHGRWSSAQDLRGAHCILPSEYGLTKACVRACVRAHVSCSCTVSARQ